MATIRVHLLVSGRVQGVYYRASAQQEAQRLGLQGWVKNLPTGQVEALAEGDAQKVDAFIAWCHRGPPHARVDDVQVIRETPTGGFTGFVVAH